MKRAFTIATALGLGFTIAIALLYGWMDLRASNKIHSKAFQVPQHDVAVVLGTARWIAQGRENLYFRHRIDAAADLYLNGRVQKILVSGDNSRDSYNEPREMFRALVDAGVGAEDIVMDYAGFRTFDSMVRASQVFGLSRFIVVSQRFHLSRALYIARSKGLEVSGYAAFDPCSSRNTRIREIGARVKAFLDCQVLSTKPHFLGEPIPIALDQNPGGEGAEFGAKPLS